MKSEPLTQIIIRHHTFEEVPASLPKRRNYMERPACTYTRNLKKDTQGTFSGCTTPTPPSKLEDASHTTIFTYRNTADITNGVGIDFTSHVSSVVANRNICKGSPSPSCNLFECASSGLDVEADVQPQQPQSRYYRRDGNYGDQAGELTNLLATSERLQENRVSNSPRRKKRYTSVVKTGSAVFIQSLLIRKVSWSSLMWRTVISPSGCLVSTPLSTHRRGPIENDFLKA